MITDHLYVEYKSLKRAAAAVPPHSIIIPVDKTHISSSVAGEAPGGVLRRLTVYPRWV